jgi:hypothetical protein
MLFGDEKKFDKPCSWESDSLGRKVSTLARNMPQRRWVSQGYIETGLVEGRGMYCDSDGKSSSIRPINVGESGGSQRPGFDLGGGGT